MTRINTKTTLKLTDEELVAYKRLLRMKIKAYEGETLYAEEWLKSWVASTVYDANRTSQIEYLTLRANSYTLLGNNIKKILKELDG